MSKSQDEFSILELEKVVLENIRLLILIPLAVTAMAAAMWIFRGGSDYVARSSFLPESSDGGALSQYAGIAAQLGLGLPGSGGGESAEFYAELVESDVLLRTLARKEYAVEPNGSTSAHGDLFQLYKVEGDTPADKMRSLVARLKEDIRVQTKPEAGILTLETTAPWADLAEALNEELLRLVNDFNLERRQSRATAEREFIEERRKEARRELAEAEEQLREFLEENRSYQNSPQLLFEANRLQRAVDLRQQMYSSLMQAYEEARVAEVRNTPVITLLDPPAGTAEPASSLLGLMITAGIAGSALAIGLVFLKALIGRQRVHDPESRQEVKRLRRRAWQRLTMRAGDGD